MSSLNSIYNLKSNDWNGWTNTEWHVQQNLGSTAHRVLNRKSADESHYTWVSGDTDRRNLDPWQHGATILKPLYWLWMAYPQKVTCGKKSSIFFAVYLVAKSWLFCDPMDCSLLRSSVREVPQAKILEWVVISFSRGPSWPKDWTCVSCLGRQILYHRATWEAPILLLLACIVLGFARPAELLTLIL